MLIMIVIYSCLWCHEPAALIDNQLRIEGTNLGDTIIVRQIKNAISIDGIAINWGSTRLSQVSANSITSIRIDSLGDDDLP